MAITVSGSNPVQVTVSSNTTTTNDTHPTGAPNARGYVVADDIVGLVGAGRWVRGFGLRLETTDVNGAIALTNHGVINIDQPIAALELIGNGGLVSYAGTGAIINHDGAALNIVNSVGSGGVNATIGHDISANNATAVSINTHGAIAFTVAA